MAVSFFDVLRSSAPLCTDNSARLMAVPPLSPIFIRGGRTVGRRCSGKSSTVSLKFGLSCRSRRGGVDAYSPDDSAADSSGRSMAAPPLSPVIIHGGRSVGLRCSGKLSNDLVKSGLLCRARRGGVDARSPDDSAADISARLMAAPPLSPIVIRGDRTVRRRCSGELSTDLFRSGLLCRARRGTVDALSSDDSVADISARLMAAPPFSPIVIRGGRTVRRRCSGKLSTDLVQPRLHCGAHRGSVDASSPDDSAAEALTAPDRDYKGTPYIPVYVMLPLGTINMECELVDPVNLIKKLKTLKSIGVDGVMVDCWWGIVEGHAPQQYNWAGYRKLFQIVRHLDLRLQVVMSFHECGGNVGDDVHIPLPRWAIEIGSANPDIFFTDREGRRNHECLTWGIDSHQVLRGRNALQVYSDFMGSFRVEFDEFFEDGFISEMEIGLGPCGELRYPSYAANHGWEYPGIGEFQCYDKYLMESLKKAADAIGEPTWAEPPSDTDVYKCTDLKSAKFFNVEGTYKSFRGRFFLDWYCGVLLDHADLVLAQARLVFGATPIAAKVAGVHWQYQTESHAAELTAGYFNTFGTSGYSSIMSTLKRHGAALNFTCVELSTKDQNKSCSVARSDPEGLVWQVLQDAWSAGISVAAENALPCYERSAYDRIVSIARPDGAPCSRPHIAAFTYLRLTPQLVDDKALFGEFSRFVRQMHGC